MCDYSLMHVKSRRAAVGDKLRTTNFGTGTRGFASPDDPNTAVCVLPGTELAFDTGICAYGAASPSPHRTAIFRQINGQRQAAAFDLTAIRRGEAPDPRVYPGDIIIVDGSKTKELQRQILNSIPILSIFKPF